MTKDDGYIGDRPCSEMFKTVCVFDCLSSTVSVNSCPDGGNQQSDYTQYNDHLYRWQGDLSTFQVHKKECEDSGGLLADFRTAKEFLGVMQHSGKPFPVNIKSSKYYKLVTCFF